MTENEIKYEKLYNLLPQPTKKRVVKAVLAFVTKWDKDDPQPLKSLKAYYKRDEHLNNIPLNFWDSLAEGLGLTGALSLGESVCLLKYIIIKRLRG